MSPRPRWSVWCCESVLCLLNCVCSLPAQQVPPVVLPQPQMDVGKPLMQTLHERRTTREFSSDALSPQQISNLLWAAFGINRRASGQRTAPSAMNAQEIDIYVASEQGLSLYEAAAHQLQPVLAEDIRSKTSGQGFATNAPITLIFVADYARMTKAKPEQKEFYSGIDTGYISQNVYLFCASDDLGTVVHDLDRSVLGRAMQLRPEQHIVLAQAVGRQRK